MDLATREVDFRDTELLNKLPKCNHSRYSSAKPASEDDDIHSLKALDITDLESSLIKAITQDDKVLFVTHSHQLFKGDSTTYRGVALKLLFLCCSFDAVECATALVNGELDVVPVVNDVQPAAGMSALHAAAEAHAARCVELLLKRRARTDLRSKDGRALLALEMSLYSSRLDVIWNPDDYSIEDLVVLLSEKDLTTVKLLCEKTKEIQEVAYASAIGGRIVALAALLIVAAEKINHSTLVLHDTDSVAKEKATIYGCMIEEALSLGCDTSPSKTTKLTCISTRSESDERRKQLLSEIELLQLFGAAAPSGSADKKLTSPLIRAIKVGDEAIVQLLLKTNLDVNDVDAEGNSALHWSLRMSRGSAHQIKTLWLLLKHGARVSQRNKLGLTAFHIAADNGNSQALQVLLLEDPDGIDSKTIMKETPLFFAVKNDHIDCVELLLRWGASSEVLNLRRERPIDLAKSQDMRFMLNPANINLMNRALPAQRKHAAMLQGNDIILETFKALLSMTDDGTSAERICSTTKTEICKYFETSRGCVRGSKCFYAHGEEELRQMKQGMFSAQELRRKVFVGGLPPLLDSESLGKFFEQQFGSVEDANVVKVQSGDQSHSRGFGFVTFKHEKSVSEAVRAHYTTIMGKQVEIKSVIQKCMLQAESQKLFPRQCEEKQNEQHQSKLEMSSEKNIEEMPRLKTTAEAELDKVSWVDRLLRGQPKTYSSNDSLADFSSSSVDHNIPSWLRTFKKWLPSFLRGLSKHPKDEEYPLSSLKGDFRAACGLELDHASLGYQKLSDFIKSFPDLCRMEVVPVGRHGPANHMILLPCFPRPHRQLLQPLTMCCQPSHAESTDHNADTDSNDSKFLQDLFSDSCVSVSTTSCNNQEVSPSQEVPEENSAFKDSSSSACSGFMHCIKPNLNLHAQATLCEGKGAAEDTDDESGGIGWSREMQLRHRQRHLVLESLARRRSSSLFFLREYDFYDSYKQSITQGKCFWCDQPNLLWANFPCQHLLWCNDCKLLATEAADNSEHRCVVCDMKVQRFILIPRNGCSQPSDGDVTNHEEFPPLGSYAKMSMLNPIPPSIIRAV